MPTGDSNPMPTGSPQPEGYAAPPSEKSSVRKKAQRDFSKGSLWGHVATFGTPLVVAMGFMALFNLIDIFIVGRLENAHEAVAIVSICDALVTLFVVLVTGIGNAAHALIARAVGTGDGGASKTATTQAMLLTIGISAIVFLLGAAAPGLTLQVLGVDPNSQLFQVGVEYLRIALMGGFTMFFVVMMTSILRGIGNSVWPTTVLVLVNVLNIVLAIVFVLGPTTGVDFGLGWGVLGAAWAALTARIVGFSLCLIIFIFGVGRHYIHRKLSEWAPNPAVLKRLLRIGLPSSAQLIVRVGGILALTAIVFAYLTTDADTTIGSAFALCVKLDLVALFLALGWGQAAGTIVGQSIGRDDVERGITAGWIATIYGVAMTGLIGVVFWIYASPIVDFFFEKGTNPPVAIVEGAEDATAEEAAAAWEARRPTISLPDGMLEADLGSLRWNGAEQAAEALPVLYEFFQPAYVQVGIRGEVKEADGRYRLQVSGTSDGTPAQSAGIKDGDKLLAIDGASLVGTSPDVANNVLRSHLYRGTTGDTFDVTVLRDGAEQTVTLTLAAALDGGFAGTPAAGEAWSLYEATKHRLVVYHGSWYLRVMVFGWIFLAVGIVISQAMTGAGQTRTPVILDAIICLPVLLGMVIAVNTVSPLAGNPLWAAVGSWSSVAISYAVLAVLYLFVFRARHWLKTIPPHDPAEAALPNAAPALAAQPDDAGASPDPSSPPDADAT